MFFCQLLSAFCSLLSYIVKDFVHACLTAQSGIAILTGVWQAGITRLSGARRELTRIKIIDYVYSFALRCKPVKSLSALAQLEFSARMSSQAGVD